MTESPAASPHPSLMGFHPQCASVIAQLLAQHAIDRVAILGDQEVLGFDGLVTPLERYLTLVRPVACTVFEHPSQTACINTSARWVKLDLSDAKSADFAGYDLIIDGGTLEHVANMPAVLAAAWEGLSPGGHFVAGYPVNNLCDHGYWQPQPRFFADFFRVNGAERCSLQILRWVAGEDQKSLIFLDYSPCLPGQMRQPPWAESSGQVGVFLIARKPARASSRRVVLPSEFA